MSSLRHVASLAAVLTLAASAVAAPPQERPTAAVAVAGTERIRAAGTSAGFTIVKTAAGVGCRDATPEEAAAAAKRSGREPLHVIKSGRADKTATGLTIVLRATSQLEGFPSAKNAFIRAADEWEARISNTITIVIDVDYGPKNFGDPFEPLVIGSTNPQDLIGLTPSSTRSRLLAGASSATETSLYTSLPSSGIPTDQGSVSLLGAPSANLRAIGAIAPVANPDTETNFGPVPSIGFNSAFAYDFDPSDGIDSNKTDFNAVVLHEIGHVLGFGSDCGFKEFDPSSDLSLTILDLFRFRPGVTTGTFGSASRILSSGGTQIFFAGGSALGLSTGRPDGTGGDGEQASHWKDDEQTGDFIGLMDPTIGNGQQEDITANDLLAFDSIGYRFTSSPTVTLANLAANLAGNTLTITGQAQGPRSITLAEVTLLDIGGNAITDLPDTALSIGSAGAFTLTFNTLGEVLAATAARVTIRDDSGGVSPATVADFSGFQTGAPVVTKVKLKGTKLKFTGDGYGSAMLLELNGIPQSLPVGSTVKPTGKKANIEISGLALRQGANRIRLLLNGKHSNIVILTRS